MDFCAPEGDHDLASAQRASAAATSSPFNGDRPSLNHSTSAIRLAHIISDLSIGGAEMMLYKLLAETDRDRFAPVVISLIDRGDLRERIAALGIPVHVVEMKPGVPSPLGFFRLVRLLRRLEPEVVLGWMYHSCLAAQLATFFLARRPRVFWGIHYAGDSFASEKLLTVAVFRVCARLSKLADRIIFVSRASQAQHGQFGYHLGESCVIPNGIDISEFVPSRESRNSLRAELGWSDDSLLIGMTGRYHPLKDHANFVQAAALTAKQHANARFVMIGQGVDNHNGALRHLIETSGLAHRVRLLGERRDIPRITAALDVFSLSSYSESFPNVIGEAMACEVPCAVTDVGDARWIVGEAGIVVPPRDPRDLAAAWSELIELGEGGRRELGRAARVRVIERFQLKSVVARYEALYSTSPSREVSNEFALNAPVVRKTSLKTQFDDSSVG